MTGPLESEPEMQQPYFAELRIRVFVRLAAGLRRNR